MKYTIEIDYETKRVTAKEGDRIVATPEGLVRGRRTLEQGIHEALFAIHMEHPPFMTGDQVQLMTVSELSVHKVLAVRLDGAGIVSVWQVKISASKSHRGCWVDAGTLEKYSGG